MRDLPTAAAAHLASRGDWLWLFVCLALSSAWCLGAGARLGVTFDERIYVATGVADWHAGSHRGLMQLGTMPLAIDLQTLPLVVAEQARHAPLDLESELPAILPWARAMTLAFWALLLVYGWRAGRDLAGAWGGRLAAAWLASEPSLLAHASLATTDLALAACLLAFAVHYRAGRTASWPLRVALPGAWCGLALLAKASALVMAPLTMLVVALADDRRHRTAWRDGAAILVIGLLLAFVYCGSDWLPEPSFVAWARGRPGEAFARQPLQLLAEHLSIFSNAGEAIVRQVRHNLRGHGAFLLGIADARSLWFYFPLLLTIKLSEPLLVFGGAAGVGAALGAWRRRMAAGATRAAHRAGNWPLLLAATLTAYSVTFRVQLGVRMVLPVVVFLAVGVGVALARALAGAARPWQARGLVLIAAAGLACNLASALTLWPDALVFVNRFWGGAQHGYRLVSDSNYDWGQGVPPLRAWQAQQQLPELSVWYFGSDPRAAQPPLHALPLHDMPLASRADVLAALRGRVLAVGTTLLYGSGETRGSEAHKHVIAVLRERQPMAQVGTFLVFDFR